MSLLSNLKKAGDVSQRPLNILALGKSGAGKTYGALQLAKVLAENHPITGEGIVIIDTENERSGWAITDVFGRPDPPNVYVYDWTPPYNIAKLRTELIKYGAVADVVIIDSLSAFYNREGGVFDRVAQEEAKQKGAANSFVAWRKPGKEYDDMIAAVTQVPCHVIVTARTKMRRELQKSDSGKLEVVTVGDKAVLRGQETGYEFELEGELLSQDGVRRFVVSKSRVGSVPEGKVFDGSLNEENASTLVANYMGYMGKYEKREIKPAAEVQTPELPQWSEEALVAGIEQAIPDKEIRNAIVVDIMGNATWVDVVATSERMASFYEAVVEAYQDILDKDEPDEEVADEETIESLSSFAVADQEDD